MKLYTAHRAPNPRRVTMFLAEKGVREIPMVEVDLNALEHKREPYRLLSPLAKVPALELDDGRVLTESRAICSWIESRWPEPNLMGRDAEERAFIEMADRQAEFALLLPIAQVVRHTHPGLAALEQPQFPDYGHAQRARVSEAAAWFDHVLKSRPWLAGDRFTVADITAFCAIEFARLMKFKPADEGFSALQDWRDRVAARPSAQA